MGCQGVCLRRAIRISQSHLLLNFTEYIGHMGVRTSCDAGTPSSKSDPLGGMSEGRPPMVVMVSLHFTSFGNVRCRLHSSVPTYGNTQTLSDSERPNLPPIIASSDDSREAAPLKSCQGRHSSGDDIVWQPHAIWPVARFLSVSHGKNGDSREERDPVVGFI